MLSLIHRCRHDGIQHYLYKAILLYNVGNYRKVLAMLDRRQEKLQSPLSMYLWDLSEEKYTAAGGEYLPILTVARNIFCDCSNIKLEGILEIRELYIETRSGPSENFTHPLIAPPIVVILFLKFLCLKLTCHHINRRHFCFNIKSISFHPLLWMNVMLDFICMVFAGM